MQTGPDRTSGAGPPATRWWLILILVLIGIVALAKALAL
jgi:hypothetical protein